MAEHAGSSGAERRFGIGCDSLGEQPLSLAFWAPGHPPWRPPPAATEDAERRFRRAPRFASGLTIAVHDDRICAPGPARLAMHERAIRQLRSDSSWLV
jgi:hypothetical protein